MNKRSSAPARILAVITLVIAFVVAVAVISGALGGGDSSDRGRSGNAGRQSTGADGGGKEESVPAVYVIKNGDTLIGIAHRLGVPMARIEELNPEVDPQILRAGEKLKLREAP